MNRERPVLRMQEMTEAVVHTPRSAPSLEGTSDNGKPLARSPIASITPLDNQEIVRLVAAAAKISLTPLPDSEAGISREGRNAQSIPDIQQLVQGIESLCEITADLRDAMLELNGSLKGIQPRPPERKGWLSRLIPWGRGKR